jgi:hypothetical protein
MNKITISLQYENGQAYKPMPIMELTYLLFQPDLLQIDDKFFVKVGPTTYKQAIPQVYRTKKTEEVVNRETNREVYNVAFIDTRNGNEAHNPYITVVEIPASLTGARMSALEQTQQGVERSGGSWKQILEDAGVEYREIWAGRDKAFDKSGVTASAKYTLREGNY